MHFRSKSCYPLKAIAKKAPGSLASGALCAHKAGTQNQLLNILFRGHSPSECIQNRKPLIISTYFFPIQGFKTPTS